MPAQLTARFQPYTLTMLDSHSAGGFSKRQLLTFPSLRRKCTFMLFLRRKCHAHRRGNWCKIPGTIPFERAIDYATRHGSYVYDIPVKKVPVPRRRGSDDSSDDDSDDDSGDDDLVDEDIHSDDENL